MKVDMSKQYTCNGKPVRLLCVDGPAPFPVIGIVGQEVCMWPPSGDSYTGPLIEFRQKRRLSGWLNVYPARLPVAYASRDEADRRAATDRIACVDLSRVEYEIGEGLENES